MDKKKVLFKWGTVVGVIALYSLLIAPIIMKIITGMVGTIAALVIGGIAWMVLPAFAEWLTLKRFALKRIVISKAPVEKLWKSLKERTKAMNEFRLKLQEQLGMLEGYKRRTGEMIKKYPQDKQIHEEKLKRFENVVAVRVEKYKQLKEEVVIFKDICTKAEDDWEMACADAEMGALLEVGEDFERQLEERFALKAVEQKVDAAFAAMTMTMIDEEAAVKEYAASGSTRAIKYTLNGTVDIGNILAPVTVLETA